MGHTLTLIGDVQKQVHADDDALDEARTRRRSVLQICRGFRGALRTYVSGSLAAGVVTHPVVDADGGVVFDRRVYPSLGPDGDGEAPTQLVSDLHHFLGPEIRRSWSEAKVYDMKRGLRIFFHEPLSDGQDPYVDVVVGIGRGAGAGLWIPNLDIPRWDPSDPEKHVELFTQGSRGLRRARAQVTRLGKAWNNQYGSPGMTSFNVCALAREAITTAVPVDEGLSTFFDHAATALNERRTEDPAGVSGPIDLKEPKEVVVGRLRDARDQLREALANDDDAHIVGEALHGVFWKYLPAPASASSKNEVATRLRHETPRLRATGAGVVIAGAVKRKRAFGGLWHG
jgi:hypothetical protein